MALDRWHRVGLITIIVLALGLRLWGSWYDLPYIYHPDEPVTVRIAVHHLKDLDLNPHFFHWGTAYFYLVTLAYMPYYLAGRLTGTFHSLGDLAMPEGLIMGVVRIALPMEVWLARLVSIVLGAATVWLVYRIGRRHFGRWAGLAGAAFLAVLPAHVHHSQTARPDAAMIFFLTLCLLQAVHATEARDAKKTLFWAGLWGGLAAATKYNAAVPVVFIVGFSHISRHGRDFWRRFDSLWAGVGGVLGFVLGNPFAVLDAPAFWEGFTFATNYYATANHAGMQGGALGWYLGFLVKQGALPWLALGYGVWSVRTKDRKAVLLGIVCLLYFLLISLYNLRNDRTILPLFPLLALLAGAGLAQLIQRLWHAKRSAAGVKAVLITLIVAMTFIPLLNTTLRADWALTQERVQTVAKQWIENNIPRGSKIVQETYTAYLSKDDYELFFLNNVAQHPAEWYRQQKVDYVVMSQVAYGRFFAEPQRYAQQIQEYQALMDSFELVGDLHGAFLARPDINIRIYQVTDK